MTQIDEECRRRFEAHRLAGGDQALEGFLPDTDAPSYASTLEELILIDLEFRWKTRDGERTNGAPPSPQDYAERFPELARPEVVRRLEEESAWLARRHPRSTERAGVKVGHYELRELAGRGAFADVWRAHDQKLARDVALKIPRVGLAGQAGVLDRVRRETQSAARLSHPGIVSVYEVGSHKGRPFFALEYVSGPTLAERLREGPLTPRDAARLVARVADAVQYAHECGVVHRDIKPGNVLIGEDERPRLADFGLAQLATAESELTRQGDVLGTPSYMAPEQARGAGDRTGPATDVYGLGAVLYELIARRIPFEGLTAAATIHAVLNDEPKPPSRCTASIPTDLETICLKAMSKEPAARYASAQDLATDLRRYLRRLPIQARRRGLWSRLGLWVQRNPAVTATLAASLVVILAVGGVGLTNVLGERTRFREQRDQARENLLRSLIGEAEAVVEAQGADWYPRAMERLREAADLATRPEDKRILRDLVLRCESTDRVSINRVALWDAAHGRTYALAASPDGTRVAAVTNESILWTRALDSGRVSAYRRLEHARPTSLAWNLDGSTILVGFDDGRVEAREAKGLDLLTSWRVEGSAVRSMALHPGREVIALGLGGGQIELLRWRNLAHTLESMGRLAGHEDGTLALDFSPDGTRLLSGGADRAIRIWDWRNDRVEFLAREDEAVRIVAFSPDGARVATSTKEQLGYRVLAPPDPQLQAMPGFAMFESNVSFLRFGRRGHILSASSDGSVAVHTTDFDRLAHGRTGLGAIYCGTPLGSGAELLFGHADGRLSRWRIATPGSAHRWHTVQGAEFVAGTQRLVTDRGTLDYEAAEEPTAQSFATVPVTCMATSDAGVYAMSADGDLLLWRDRAGEPQRIEACVPGATCLGISPDGLRLSVGCGDGGVWRSRARGTGPEFDEIQTGLGRIHAVLLDHPEPGTTLVLGELGLVTLDAGGRRKVLDDRQRSRGDMAVTTGLIAISGPEGSIEILRRAGGRPVRVLEAHDHAAKHVRFSPDGRRLISSDGTGEVRVWDTATWDPVWTHRLDAGSVDFVVVDPTGEVAVVGGSIVEVLDLREQRAFAELFVLKARSAAFSPDGTGLLLTGGNGGAWRWDVAALLALRDRVRAKARQGVGTAPARVPYQQKVLAGGHAWWAWDLATSADGRWVATSGHTGDVNLWAADTLRHVHTLNEVGGLAWTVAFSPDSKTIASGVGNGAILWDVDTREEQARLAGHEAMLSVIAFHPSGDLVLTCGLDGRVLLWDPEDGHAMGALDTGGGYLHDLAFAPDGRRLAGAARDGSVLFWDATAGALIDGSAPVGRLPMRTAAVTAIAYDPSGALLATGGSDGEVLLRDAETGAILVALRGSPRVRGLSFSGSGHALAAASYAAPSVTWDLRRLRKKLRDLGLDWN